MSDILSGLLLLVLGQAIVPMLRELVDGVIIALERQIVVGDQIGVNERDYVVLALTWRMAICKNLDSRKTVFLQNSFLLAENVTNYTRSGGYETNIAIPLRYDGDIGRVRSAIRLVANWSFRDTRRDVRVTAARVEADALIVVAKIPTRPGVLAPRAAADRAFERIRSALVAAGIDVARVSDVAVQRDGGS